MVPIGQHACEARQLPRPCHARPSPVQGRPTCVGPCRQHRRAAVPDEAAVGERDAGHRRRIQRGRPMLVEFWDFCRPNSLRTLPYLQAWHERYAEHGLRTIGVHCPGFDPSREEHGGPRGGRAPGHRVSRADRPELEVWREYENAGWPARYLFDGRARLFEYHYGEGAYAETELAIQRAAGRAARAAAGRCAPRMLPARCWRRRPRTSRAPTRGRMRRAACGRCSTGRGRCG